MSDNPLRDAIYAATSYRVSGAEVDTVVRVLRGLAGPSGLLDLTTGREVVALRGPVQTHPSTLYMDGTSPVTVKVQATTEELRDLHRQEVLLVRVERSVSTPEPPPRKVEHDALTPCSRAEPCPTCAAPVPPETKP